MAFGFRKFLSGINLIPKTTSTVNSAGDLDFDTTANKMNLHNGTSSSPIVTEAHTATLTNKTISGASNTISNIPSASLTGQVAIANGGTGQSTQQASLNALAGAVTSGQFLRGDGTNITVSAIQAADVPTLNQNTTGTAANITATSNSTLTTLSALSLPGSQVSGDISGNAANVTGTVAIANGGTGQTSKTPAFDALSPLSTKGDTIVHDGTDNIRLPVGTNDYVLTADSTQASGVKWAPSGTPLHSGAIFQTSVPQASNTILPILSVNFDQYSGMDLVNNWFLVPSTKIYEVSARSSFGFNTGVATYAELRLYVNGGFVDTFDIRTLTNTGFSGLVYCTGSIFLTLTAGDMVQIVAYQNSAAANTITVGANVVIT